VSLVHEQVADLLAVEHDDRDPFQVATHQAIVALDVDLLEAMTDALKDPARVVAQMAAGAAVEHEAHRSRSPLA
jgi:hypothetical protein